MSINELSLVNTIRWVWSLHKVVYFVILRCLVACCSWGNGRINWNLKTIYILAYIFVFDERVSVCEEWLDFLRGSESVQVLHCLFTSVFSLKIKLSREAVFSLIDQYKIAPEKMQKSLSPSHHQNKREELSP